MSHLKPFAKQASIEAIVLNSLNLTITATLGCSVYKYLVIANWTRKGVKVLVRKLNKKES